MGSLTYPCETMRFFQIREDSKPVEHRVYPTLATACRALVERSNPKAYVVELDGVDGAVVREFTLAECQQILHSSSSD